MKVEYSPKRERKTQKHYETIVKNKNHAKRADQFGILLFCCAILIVILVMVILYLNGERYLFEDGKRKGSEYGCC